MLTLMSFGLVVEKVTCVDDPYDVVPLVREGLKRASVSMVKFTGVGSFVLTNKVTTSEVGLYVVSGSFSKKANTNSLPL